MKPCDICLEKECKAKNGVGSCNCDTCPMFKECPRKLHATIRLTLKCTQSCSHCCFECSPKEELHMSVNTAKKVSKFLKNNEVYSGNLMGGEIFCNPNWKEILDLIVPQMKIVRIVSNGDWVVDQPDFAEYLTKFKNCYVSISKDMWHNMINVEKAIEILTKHNIINTTPDFDSKESDLIPVGRSQFNFGLYSMFGCYCHNPEHQYTFLIDEVGDIFKCGFGIWNYDNIKNYVKGGFSKRFKEFNRIFYDQWIPNCKSCVNSYTFSTNNKK